MFPNKFIEYVCRWNALLVFVLVTVFGATSRAQTLDVVLTKCRESVANLRSFEYVAQVTNVVGDVRRFYFACDGDKYRFSDLYDPDVDGAIAAGNTRFKSGFDGIYYYGTKLLVKEPEPDADIDDSELESGHPTEGLRGGPPPGMQFAEPFRHSFCWLDIGLFANRTETLEPSNWQKIANSSNTTLAKDRVLDYSCMVASFKSGIRRYEVAFAEELGYLPVRVRRMVDDGWIGSEIQLLEFKHVRVDGTTVHFPTKVVFRELERNGDEISKSSFELISGTLNINQPISSELFRLELDPLDVKPERLQQK